MGSDGHHPQPAQAVPSIDRDGLKNAASPTGSMIEAPESQAISHYLLAPPQTRDTLLDCSGDALKKTFKPNKQPTRVNFFLDPLAGIPWAERGKDQFSDGNFPEAFSAQPQDLELRNKRPQGSFARLIIQASLSSECPS